MSDPKLEVCPAEGCGGRVRRLLGTGAGLLFKGSGFYQTDYRSSGYKEAAKGESAGAKPGPEAAKPAASAGGCGGGCACAGGAAN